MGIKLIIETVDLVSVHAGAFEFNPVITVSKLFMCAYVLCNHDIHPIWVGKFVQAFPTIVTFNRDTNT